MKKALKTVFVFLLFIVIFLSGSGLVYGQCATVKFYEIGERACEYADPNLNCPVEPFQSIYYCWWENGKCVTDYKWTGCYDENIGGGKLRCEYYSNLVHIDCNNPTGGTGSGSSYIYNRCPSDQYLSCGSLTEAEAQNKYGCFYRSYCDSYFSPELIGAGCDASNPAKAYCQWNCSCCPIGSYRSCTQGSQYTTSVTIDLTNQNVLAWRERV
jgi:hypothetical protein